MKTKRILNKSFICNKVNVELAACHSCDHAIEHEAVRLYPEDTKDRRTCRSLDYRNLYIYNVYTEVRVKCK